jgi:hypothetical protein
LLGPIGPKKSRRTPLDRDCILPTEERWGKSGTDAEGYAKEVVLADFEKPGDDDVIRKLVKDLAAAGKSTEESAIRKQAERLMAEAKTQLMAE